MKKISGFLADRKSFRIFSMKKIFLATLLMFLLCISPVFADWYSSDWKSRERLNIANDLNESRVDAIVSYEISKVYTKVDCSDVLVVYDTSNLTIPYNLTGDSPNCSIRFNVNPSASETLDDVYIYYNNPSAVAPSYAQSDELLFNDSFDDPSIGSWWWVDNGGDMINGFTCNLSAISIASNALYMKAANENSCGANLVLNKSFNPPLYVDFRAKGNYWTWSTSNFVISDSNGSVSWSSRNETIYGFATDGTTNFWMSWWQNGGYVGQFTVGSGGSVSNYADYRLDYNGTLFTSYNNAVQFANNSLTLNSPVYLMFQMSHNAIACVNWWCSDFYVDSISVKTPEKNMNLTLSSGGVEMLPIPEHGLFYNIITDVGTGFAGFMNAITEPLMSPLLIFGVISSILTIVYAIAIAIKAVLK